VTTPELLLHRERAEPARARRGSWVALGDGGGEVVGFGTAFMKWAGSPSGTPRVWVCVVPERRRHRIGSALYDAADAHVSALAPRSIDTEIEADAAGLAFAHARGFRECDGEVVYSLEPRRAAYLSELEPLLAEKRREGFELVALGELRSRRDELAAFYDAAGAWPPVDPGENRVTADELWRTTFESPGFAWDGSFALLDRRGRIASLASLTVDSALGRAEHEWTATLPELRRRRLGLLVKLATIRWARENGVRELVTSSADANVAMQTLNERLGYRRLYRRVDLVRELV
jgi:GNAT superfamily N-acetyltransferase